MSNVFEVVSAKPVPDTVKYLEDLLERAKAGEIQGFGIVISKGNGYTANGWTGMSINCVSIIGELETMKVDLIRSHIDQRYDCCGEIVE